MSRESHAKARARTKSFLDSNKIEDHMFYGPTSDNYWEENFKAVIVNMEPWGYEGRFIVDAGELHNWLDAGDTKKTSTTKYSYTILSVLLNAIYSNLKVTRDHFYHTYREKEELRSTVDRTVYYNIKSVSNDTRHQDYAGIVNSGKGDLGQLIWDEIRSLEPDVLIVTGAATVYAINNILGDSSLVYKGWTRTKEGISIYSIRHASLPSYQAWADTVNQILAEQGSAHQSTTAP